MSSRKPATVTRRRFVQSAVAGGLAGPTILRALARGATAANDRIQLGFIGVGTMGRYHLGSFLGNAQAQVVAVCDVVAERRDGAQAMTDERYADERAKGTYAGCRAYNDFRELLASDVDAVVIATPDHWHAIPAIAAARAGKDVYCEKPLTRTIGEGRAVVQAAADAGIVFQTGSQQRTEFGGLFRDAVDLVRNGRIGQVKTIRVGVGAPAIACDLPDETAPDGTDWDMWLGPAPLRAYHEALCPKGVHSHFPAWRSYREYAGGGLADMGAHHFDIAQWALDMDRGGPVTIEPPASGETSGLRFTYAGGVEMFHGGPSGCTFEGTEGTLYVDRGKIECTPEAILKERLPADAPRVFRADNHHGNWLACVRSRQPAICDAETGHRSATICHLANIGYRLGRQLAWDPVAERFDDDEANALVPGGMRSPWSL